MSAGLGIMGVCVAGGGLPRAGHRDRFVAMTGPAAGTGA